MAAIMTDSSYVGTLLSGFGMHLIMSSKEKDRSPVAAFE